MSVERDILNEINFDEAVETFAMKKARKKVIQQFYFYVKYLLICFIINLVVFFILV